MKPCGPQSSSVKDESKAFLRTLPLFADVTDDDFDQLFEMTPVITVPAGHRLIEEGTRGDDALYVILDGELEVTTYRDGRDTVLADRRRGEFVGEIALLEDVPRSASVRALRDSCLLVVSRRAFERLLACNPNLPLVMLRTVTSRLRNTEAMLQQQQKMAALGTLAAGLAHELNNPAAAVQRSTAQLTTALTAWERAGAALSRLKLEAPEQAAMEALGTGVPARVGTTRPADPIAIGEQEDAVQDWLEDRGIDKAWEMAPVLVAAGLSRPALEQVLRPFSDDRLQAVLAWMVGRMAAQDLLGEIKMGAERISEIVKAVKTYSYLDQAPIQQIDLHDSLDNTLVILRHKLKGITVRRQYADDIPAVEGYGSELNQVWTNLIDNAVDALQGAGEIVVRTRREGDTVVVEITDNGSGIPPEIQPRIFEAFYTTKGPGSGSGLGLSTSYNIVRKHRGKIELESRPGGTTFRVTVPMALSRH